METGFDLFDMKRLVRSQKGQSYIELALAICFFALFVMGIMQIVLISSGQIRCQIVARRSAWNLNVWNNWEKDPYKEQRKKLLPNSEKPIRIDRSGGREKGMAFAVSTTVPAIGFFRIVKPTGFKITAKSAVIAYNKKPIAADLIDKGIHTITEFWDNIIK